MTSSTVARSRDPDQLDPRLVVDAIVRYVFPVVVIVGIENLYSPKIHGRYRQDTDTKDEKRTIIRNVHYNMVFAASIYSPHWHCSPRILRSSVNEKKPYCSDYHIIPFV